VIGSACPCAAEGEIIARCALAGTRAPSSELLRTAYPSSALRNVCFRDARGVIVAVAGRTEVMAVGTEATSSLLGSRSLASRVQIRQG